MNWLTTEDGRLINLDYAALVLPCAVWRNPMTRRTFERRSSSATAPDELVAGAIVKLASLPAGFNGEAISDRDLAALRANLAGHASVDAAVREEPTMPDTPAGAEEFRIVMSLGEPVVKHTCYMKHWDIMRDEYDQWVMTGTGTFDITVDCCPVCGLLLEPAYQDWESRRAATTPAGDADGR